ncbi:MAG TPA: CheR family methyltransferase [Kouleothrix sp.]|uniref:CheR family methyltransferase n=1 Tax=Kouleothrix sp. TaxID=2779161 RepID=UPI002B66AC00|nr:CheR family methyltransferase [Kouleothrix sp.]
MSQQPKHAPARQHIGHGATPTPWLSPEQFAHFRALLADYSGISIDSAHQRALEQGLAQRLQATGETLATYRRWLGTLAGRAELRQLSELLLNHETMFFRNGPHFRALRDVLLPELHQRKPPGEPLRIWSAGCATGEEAYSLAISALETLGQPPARPVEIWATDLSEPALQSARAGMYRGRSLQNVPPELLQRYFTPHDGGFGPTPAVRALVRFAQLNLLEPFPAEAQNVDIIFCQNVTIYFQLHTCQALIARFYSCLPDGGMLFLGFSETLWNVSEQFATREVAGAYVYCKGAATPPEPPAARKAQPRPPAEAPSARPRRVPAVPVPSFNRHAGAAKTDRALLDSGYALLSQGRSEEALDHLRQVAPQSPLVGEALLLIARGHADRGDLDLAIAEVQRSIEIDALNHAAYLLLGTIYSRQEQWPAAIEQLERARYLEAESALVSFRLAEAYRQAGRFEKALLEYRNTLQKLDRYPPGELLDGVAVGWLRETCQRHLAQIQATNTHPYGA